MDKPILNLGCGNKLVAGAVQHDRIKHRDEIDVVWDLNILPWPWEDGSFDRIVAWAVLEHLRQDLIESMNECWRILRPGGQIQLKLPYWQHENSYTDPTHYWHYTLKTCDIFDPHTEYGSQYRFYTDKKWALVMPARLNNGGSSFFVTLQVIK
jgi:predicted SAM-dependent methyltransferase